MALARQMSILQNNCELLQNTVSVHQRPKLLKKILLAYSYFILALTSGQSFMGGKKGFC